ncbi:MAG: hypothetical protein ACHQQS_08855 [Thermoanaerobaculales bacterium]
MPRLPAFDAETRVVSSPHVVILGAGASKAAIPHGDPNGRIAPALKELALLPGIAPILARIGVALPAYDFEAIYDDLATSRRYPAELTAIERAIRAYFEHLRLPDVPTVYDYLLLALRGQDFVATFNWDPLLAQAFRRNAAAAKLPTILHLHGNVDIGLCLKDNVAGFLGDACRKCARPFEPSRLLYPVRHKNYDADPFIKSEWARLRHALDRAYFLTIFGYAAPETDVEAKSLLLGAWSANQTVELAQVNIIDIKPETELEAKWREFFTGTHFGIHAAAFDSWLFHYPRRNCEALASFTLDNRPWPRTPFPSFSSLGDLHTWIRPLLAEEQTGQFTGKTWGDLSSS